MQNQFFKFLRRNYPPIIGLFVLSTIIIIVDLEEIRGTLLRTNLWLFILSLVLLISQIFAVFRWQLILKKMKLIIVLKNY